MNSRVSCLPSARGRASSTACAAISAEIELGVRSSTRRPAWSRATKSRSSTRRSSRSELRDTTSRYARRSSSSCRPDILERELDVADDRGQRRAQVVRDERDELVLQLVGLDELVVLQREQHLRLLGVRARGPLALAQPLERAQDPVEAQDDEDRDRASPRARRPGRPSGAPRRYCTSSDERRAQEGSGQQRDADRVHAQARPPTAGLRQLAHRRMQRRRRPEDVAEQPAEIDPVAASVRARRRTPRPRRGARRCS